MYNANHLTRSVSAGEVTPLAHELGDDAVELGSLVPLHAALAGAQLSEVLCAARQEHVRYRIDRRYVRIEPYLERETLAYSTPNTTAHDSAWSRVEQVSHFVGLYQL